MEILSHKNLEDGPWEKNKTRLMHSKTEASLSYSLSTKNKTPKELWVKDSNLKSRILLQLSKSNKKAFVRKSKEKFSKLKDLDN